MFNTCERIQPMAIMYTVKIIQHRLNTSGRTTEPLPGTFVAFWQSMMAEYTWQAFTNSIRLFHLTCSTLASRTWRSSVSVNDEVFMDICILWTTTRIEWPHGWDFRFLIWDTTVYRDGPMIIIFFGGSLSFVHSGIGMRLFIYFFSVSFLQEDQFNSRGLMWC